MIAQQTSAGLVADREWIEASFGVSQRTIRRRLPVHDVVEGRVVHLLTPGVVRELSTLRPRKRAPRGAARERPADATRRAHQGNS